MIIYFADRSLNILGGASTSLPGGFRLYEDFTTEDIDSGVNTFSCKIGYNDKTRTELEAAVVPGRFIIKSSGRAFTDKENSYDSLYQIIETEFDTLSQELYLYAEDAGLDLINRVCQGVKLENKTLQQMLTYFIPSDWTVNLNGAPSGTKTYEWSGESTATERINSVVNLFGCELYYSFLIERFEVTAKVINVVPKRGVQVATHQLRLNREVNRIVTKTSIADLATAYTVTGGTPDGQSSPINLIGYSYTYTDPDTGDVYMVDTTTGQMRNTSAMKRWASALDTDGLILKSFTFDTTEKATLAGEARASLQTVSGAAVNYDIDFAELPDDVKIGDRVYIIDEAGELYLDARMLKIESSTSDMSVKATVGEFLIKDGGISDQMKELASQIAVESRNIEIISEEMETMEIDNTILRIDSSRGTVFKNNEIFTVLEVVLQCKGERIQTVARMHEVYGDSAYLQWYQKRIDDENWSIVSSADPRLSDGGFKFTLTPEDVDTKVVFMCEIIV